MIALLKRDLSLSLRSGGGAVTVLLFYLAVVVAMPFAVGPNSQLLATIGGATLWIGALLAGLLGLERIFQADYEDGSLDQMMIAGLYRTFRISDLVAVGEPPKADDAN